MKGVLRRRVSRPALSPWRGETGDESETDDSCIDMNLCCRLPRCELQLQDSDRRQLDDTLNDDEGRILTMSP